MVLFFEAGVNRVSVHLGNESMPTGQRNVGTRLLPPFENGHFSSHEFVTIARINY